MKSISPKEITKAMQFGEIRAKGASQQIQKRINTRGASGFQSLRRMRATFGRKLNKTT